MGGIHAALADDMSVLFNNPAGFRSAGPELVIVDLTIGLAGPIFDIASIISESMSSDPATIIAQQNVQQLLKNFYASLNLLGPISFGYVGNGLGFGISDNTIIRLSSRGTVPTITTTVGEEFVFGGGYSFRIPLGDRSVLDLGFLFKGWISSTIVIEKDILTLISAFDDLPSLFFTSPFYLTLGAGVDLGLRFAFTDRFAVGIVGRNLYAPSVIYAYSTLADFQDSATSIVSFAQRPIDLSAGILYRPPLGFLERYVSDLKLVLDYTDILDFLTHPATASNPVLHAGLGIELVLLEILSIRGGFNQGLLSAGLGFDLSLFTLSMAMFGTELSTEPGIRPVFNVAIGIAVKL